MKITTDEAKIILNVMQNTSFKGSDVNILHPLMYKLEEMSKDESTEERTKAKK